MPTRERPALAAQRWTVYDGRNPYADFDGEGNLTRRYLYGPAVDMIMARLGAEGEIAWYLTDHLGSVRDLADTSGQVLDHIAYDSFGGILAETNPAAGDRFKFTAREFDAAIGQYSYRARYYDAAIGRFTSEDPLSFKGGQIHVYVYVVNRPTSLQDPLGEAWWFVIGFGVVSCIFAIVTLIDCGTEYLTTDEISHVRGQIDMLTRAADEAGNIPAATYLRALNITGRFSHSVDGDPSVSETRNGRLFGYRNRTILSADYFEREYRSQLLTLLHESYHAGTEDWTEEQSYEFAAAALEELSSTRAYADYVRQVQRFKAGQRP